MVNEIKINVDEYMRELNKKIATNENDDKSKILHPGKYGFLLDFTLAMTFALFGTAIMSTAFDVSANNKSTQYIESMLQEIRTYYNPASTMKTGYDFMEPLPELVFDNYTVVPNSENSQQNCKGNELIESTDIKPSISI